MQNAGLSGRAMRISARRPRVAGYRDADDILVSHKYFHRISFASSLSSIINKTAKG
jgi:hypothetical protein